MGRPNSRRARRRHRGKYRQFYANYVFWFGQWLVKTYTERTIDLGDGRTIVVSNESWNPPH